MPCISLGCFPHLVFSAQPNAGAKVLFGNEKQNALLVANRQELATETLPVLGRDAQGAEEDLPLVAGKTRDVVLLRGHSGCQSGVEGCGVRSDLNAAVALMKVA